MSIFGAGTNDFASLTGIEEDYATFNDIEVNGNVYFKQPDTLTGFNSVLITNQENISGVNNENNIVNNLTSFNDNWMLTLGTGQDTFQSILKINPTNGLYFDVGATNYNINWAELSNLNNSRTNLQQQIDNLSPDLSQNIGYWGTFWTNSNLTAAATNTPYLVSYTNSDASNNGIVFNNSTHIQVQNQGIYLFVITAQVVSTNSNTGTIQFWLKKNGTNVADTAFKEELKQTAKLIAANWQLALNANDYIEIAWQTDDTSISMNYYAASGNVPGIPSVIITASQITFYQSTIADITDIKQRITGVSYTAGTTTTDISGNLSVSGRITRPTYIAPITNNEYTMKQYTDTQDTYYYGLLQSSINSINTSLNNINGTLTGISYDNQGGVDMTFVTNNMTITKNLKIQNSLGTLVTLNTYIDEQVAIAYSRGTTGVNNAKTAQDTADGAQDTANKALDKANGALTLAGGAATGVAGLGLVVGQHTTDIANLVTALGITNAAVGVVETKTQNLEAVPGVSTFTGELVVGLAGTTTLNEGVIMTPQLDAGTAVYTPTLASNEGVINITPAVQNLTGSTINVGGEGSSVNIATTGINEVSIGNAFTPVFINGVQYVPFNLASLTSIIKQVRPVV